MKPIAVSRETSTLYHLNFDPYELPDGRIVTAANVWVHRPGDPWSYHLWMDDDTFMRQRRTIASLEDLAPGFHAAVIIPAMSADLRTLRQSW